MSKERVEALLIAGGENEKLRNSYDTIKSMEDFVQRANKEGYDFSKEELEKVLAESGDSFDLMGNPTKRMIWWF